MKFGLKEKECSVVQLKREVQHCIGGLVQLGGWKDSAVKLRRVAQCSVGCTEG